ncbi:transposase (plasmid) [Jeotgalibaca sp. MA1X17-3]|uniref:transposase n=1 Tax=Jeotgalibaca sp. MA1X17-3 TaxID=2908211 RepID=UPI001F460A92|nr:transposase [Jeotgalibaca sp. MA1X17-3]UJF16755.1 transposase [Jeotgalibaca sp. MA1X17-3]
MTERRPRRTYTKEFKNQIVKLHDTGKSRTTIIQEYDLSLSSFDTWLKKSDR